MVKRTLRKSFSLNNPKQFVPKKESIKPKSALARGKDQPHVTQPMEPWCSTTADEKLGRLPAVCHAQHQMATLFHLWRRAAALWCDVPMCRMFRMLLDLSSKQNKQITCEVLKPPSSTSNRSEYKRNNANTIIRTNGGFHFEIPGFIVTMLLAT